MQDISSFLDKFKKLLGNDSEKRLFIAQTIREAVGVDVDEKKIVIKDGIARIPGSSVLRNEIFLKRDIILHKLEGNPSTKAVREVR